MNDDPRFRRYQIGRGTYGDPQVRFGEGRKLQIGAFCSIANDVVILLGGEHPHHWITTYPFDFRWQSASTPPTHQRTKGDVVIGNDVWIGQGSVILSGVNIGDGAVIGARSVVVKDVKAYEIVAGNPARHIRYRFAPEVIDALERIAWWNWSDECIAEALPLLLSADTAEFILRYDYQQTAATSP